MTELHLAAMYGTPDICSRILDDGIPASLFETTYGTPLSAASMRGTTQNVKLLLERGVNVNEECKLGATALFFACNLGRTDIINILLDAGATIEYEIHNETTILNEVAKSNDTAVAQLLLQRGADPNHASPDGTPPLHHAIRKQNLEMIRILLDQGASVNGQGNEGAGPLHIAAIVENVEIIELLCTRGAQVDAPGSPRIPPMFYAIFKNNEELLRAFLDQGAKLSNEMTTAYHTAASRGFPSMMRLLLKHASQSPSDVVSVNQTDHGGRCPLHIAADKGDLETVRILSEAGARMNDEDAKGATPLDLATGPESQDVRDYLISRGAKNGSKSVRPIQVELQNGKIINLTITLQNSAAEDAEGLSDEEAQTFTDEGLKSMIFKMLEEGGVFKTPIKEVRLLNSRH